jgi:hypothetical protein
MTESQQPQRGRFSTWREQRRVRRQLALESQMFHDAEKAGEYGGRYGSASVYHHSGPMVYGFGGGDGGGGCGGDGGGGC